MSHLRPEIEAALRRVDRPRVTVVRSGGLGDTLLVLPVVRALREDPLRPCVTLVGSEWAEALAPLLAYPPCLLRLDSPSFTPLFAPDALRDPTGAFAEADAAVVFVPAEDDLLAENARRLCPGIVAAWPVAPPAGTHAARHFLRAIVEDWPAPVPLPALRPSPERFLQARTWLDERLGPRPAPLAIHAGSGGRRKCWPAVHFATVARAVERPVLLVEGPADAEAVREVSRLVGGLPTASAAQLALPDLAALLCCCRGLVGNDSGISHLAGMLGIPTVAVFGPTDPVAWHPLGPNARTVGGCGTWPGPAAVLEALSRPSD